MLRKATTQAAHSWSLAPTRPVVLPKEATQPRRRGASEENTEAKGQEEKALEVPIIGKERQEDTTVERKKNGEVMTIMVVGVTAKAHGAAVAMMSAGGSRLARAVRGGKR